ncbi:Uncharacterised protein [Mycobacteroides abscessus subsp. abscessus]|nr:Uncharacterised protein [Mycobacteroides abscessus subsp. abscessus]
MGVDHAFEGCHEGLLKFAGQDHFVDQHEQLRDD